MARDVRLSVRLTPQEAAIVDEHRGGLSRSGYLRARALDLPGDGSGDGPSHREAIELLRRAALGGSTSAAIGYERALRSVRRIPEPADDLEALLKGD
jgi:hypothetical protein